MPSPDAMSPSGLKTNSQFYPSYERGNPRRRTSQEAIGKTVHGYLEQIIKNTLEFTIYHNADIDAILAKVLCLCSGLYLNARLSSLLLMRF